MSFMIQYNPCSQNIQILFVLPIEKLTGMDLRLKVAFNQRCASGHILLKAQSHFLSFDVYDVLL